MHRLMILLSSHGQWDEYQASDARGGYYRESRHWGGSTEGGRPYEDW
jgi:hypothetical protein